MGRASPLENFLPVITEEPRIGFGKFFGRTNPLVLKWDKILFEGRLRKEIL